MERGLEKGMERGREEGVQQGMERGLERGRLERDKEVVCNMLKKKLDISFISEVTSLSKAEIIKLKNSDQD